jgi:hypothetical protein
LNNPPADDDPIDAFSVHEALHTSWLVLDMFGRHVLDHRAVTANPAWADLARVAHEHLWALYQKMGLDSLDPKSRAEINERLQRDDAKRG